MKKFLDILYRFSSSWTGTIIIVLFLIFFVAQSFVIPSGSMKRTQLIGDFLFAKKFSYGIPTPHLPWVEWAIFPGLLDPDGNGHLIEGPRPKREDIVIFRNPDTPKIHYVKRCVAVGGDEILYANKKLFIHFHDKKDEASIKASYPNVKIVKARGKLWVENPYMSKYPGIQYESESRFPNGDAADSFAQLLLSRYEIDMSPVYIENLDLPTYSSAMGRKINAFYKKVEEDNYYMIGDNRDNSNDSRFWGPVPYKLIVGKPWLIYMSLEHRSYDKVMNGDQNGGGKDHAGLKRVCGDAVIESKECEALWVKQRFNVRWGRIGRLIESIQLEEPIQ